MKRIYGRAFALFVAMSMLSGCEKSQPDSVSQVVIEKERDVTEYTLAEVKCGDVRSTAKLKCVCRQTAEDPYCFDRSGLIIDRVYVKKGDKVKEGDLLAELAGEDREEQILELTFRIQRNQVLYQQAAEKEQMELNEANDRYTKGWMTKTDLGKEITRIQQQYRYAKEDYTDAIALDQHQLELWEQEDEQRRLYARQDAVVLFVKEGLEGTVSNREENIITLADSSECLMMSDQTEYRELFAPGKQVMMNIGRSEAAGDYQMVPFEPESWTDTMFFSFAEPSDIEIPVGTQGTITVPVDEKKDVLCLAKDAIHQADGRYYVYVINEYSVRTVQWVEIGLTGDDSIEIISGLQEGDKVILK